MNILHGLSVEQAQTFWALVRGVLIVSSLMVLAGGVVVMLLCFLRGARDEETS